MQTAINVDAGISELFSFEIVRRVGRNTPVVGKGYASVQTQVVRKIHFVFHFVEVKFGCVSVSD